MDVVREHLYSGELHPDGTYRPTFSGPGFERLLGGVALTEPDADDAAWQAAVHPGDRAAFDAHARRLLALVPSAVEYRLRGRDGETRWVRERSEPTARADGGVSVAGIVIDITRERALADDIERALSESNDANVQLEIARATAHHAATTDALTGVDNRRAFAEAVSGLLARSDRDAVGFAIAMIDIDHFKRINDTHGHNAGDDVLMEVAGRLAGMLRDGERVARWGGEEFIVALRDVHDVPALRRRSDGLLTAIRRTPIAVADEGIALAVTASVGAGRLLQQADLQELVGDVDRALYAAKRRGRNRAVLTVDVTTRDRDTEEPEPLRIARGLAALAAARPALPSLQRTQIDATTVAIARELQLSSDATLTCRLGAWLHDVGLLAASDEQLDRQRDGLEDVRDHTQIGETILGQIPGVAAAAPVARSHHERYDGHGYPDALVGDQIPLPARVVSVASAFVTAIGHPRAEHATALETVRRESGAAFDPSIVAALERALAAPVPD